MNDLGLYIHWPFCLTKCPYCDFNSYKLHDYDENNWLNAYLKQINFFKDYLNNNFIKTNKLCSVFFGGGTPSLIKPYFIQKIINEAEKVFGFKNKD